MKNFKMISTLFMVFLSLLVNAQTQRIVIKVPELYPEGVAYHAPTQTFFVSSVKTGTIGRVDQQGNYSEFFKARDLKASFGMKVDPQQKFIWVCLSDPNPAYSVYSAPSTLKKMARVIAIEISSGKKVKDIDLAKLYAGNHFINDLTFDTSGNIYLTDSFSPVIYKIDSQDNATVFAENNWFKAIDIGLNGIIYHPSGFLITVNNSDGTILKVDAKNPSIVTKVKIEGHFPGADGLLLINNNSLVLVQNKGVNKIYTITSTDNWRSAKIMTATAGNDRFAQPSTATMQAGQVWVLNSKLNELMNKTMPPSKDFSLQLAIFKSVN